MRGAWVALAILIACSARADLQTTPKQIAPVASQVIGVDKSKHNAESENSGAQPSPVVVNVNAADKNKTSSDNRQQKANQESHRFIEPITLFTGLLVLVGGLQVLVYWKQKGIMERALAATNSSIALARDEFFATHRPKLSVRALFVIAAYADNCVSIHFSIYNSGDAPATIDSFKFFATVRGGDSVQLLRFELGGEGPPFVIDIGEEKRLKVTADSGHLLFQYMDPHNIQIWAPDGTDISFEFRGDALFLDGAMKKRHCSFHRAYNFQTKRFSRIPDSEFEYCD